MSITERYDLPAVVPDGHGGAVSLVDANWSEVVAAETRLREQYMELARQYQRMVDFANLVRPVMEGHRYKTVHQAVVELGLMG